MSSRSRSLSRSARRVTRDLLFDQPFALAETIEWDSEHATSLDPLVALLVRAEISWFAFMAAYKASGALARLEDLDMDSFVAVHASPAYGKALRAEDERKGLAPNKEVSTRVMRDLEDRMIVVVLQALEKGDRQEVAARLLAASLRTLDGSLGERVREAVVAIAAGTAEETIASAEDRIKSRIRELVEERWADKVEAPLRAALAAAAERAREREP